jgi:hypothetical protein
MLDGKKDVFQSIIFARRSKGQVTFPQNRPLSQ